MSRIILAPIHESQTAYPVFDFISQLILGESIGSASTSAVVYSGAEDASIFLSACSIAGTQVTQPVSATDLGVTYLLTCTAITNTGQVLTLQAFLSCTPDAN